MAAVYLKSSSRQNRAGRKQYQFHPEVHLGLGTDFRMLLHAIDEAAVYLDPAPWLAKEVRKGQPKDHRRNPFRVKVKDLRKLYYNWAEFDLKSIMS